MFITGVYQSYFVTCSLVQCCDSKLLYMISINCYGEIRKYLYGTECRKSCVGLRCFIAPCDVNSDITCKCVCEFGVTSSRYRKYQWPIIEQRGISLFKLWRWYRLWNLDTPVTLPILTMINGALS